MLKITYSTLTLIVQIYISWFLGQGPPRIRHVNTTWGHLWIGKIQALKLENYEMHYLDISFLTKGPKHFVRSIIGPLSQQNYEIIFVRFRSISFCSQTIWLYCAPSGPSMYFLPSIHRTFGFSCNLVK